MINLNTLTLQAKSLLCLNGPLPNSEFFFDFLYLPLIAVDGATNQLLKKKLTPQLIIGDLDSIQKNEQTKLCEIIYVEDQDQTDFEKALLELENRHLLPCLIFGASGNELDHTLYNLKVISNLSLKYPTLFLNTEACGNSKIGIFIHTPMHAHLNLQTLISLLPFPQAEITTAGLKWNLHKKTLTQNSQATIRNRVQDQHIIINVSEGTLLVLIDDLSVLHPD